MTRRSTTTVGRIVVLTGGLIGCWFLVSSQLVGASDSSKNRLYVGGLSAPGDRVRLTVKFEDGRPVAGRYRATNVFFSCEDGDRRESFAPVTLRFHGRAFEAEMYRSGGSEGLERYMRVEGRLRKADAKVNGFFYAYTDPPDDDPAQACGTEVLMGWKAFRQR